MTTAVISLVVAIATVAACSVRAEVVDLSHDQGIRTIMSPDNPKYRAKTIFDGPIMPGVYAKFSSYSVGEHGGTHLDAPRHFHKTGHALEKVPIENTIAEGVHIDCSQEVAQDPMYSLSVEKLKAWEEENGKIPQEAAVVVNFNWSHKIDNIREYFNTQHLDKQETYKIPTVSEVAIDWLLAERDIKILAIDGPSPDLLRGKFPVHVKMLTRNRLIVENVKDPGRLSKRDFTFHATPVKFVGGTGVQVRAYAVTHAGNGSGALTASGRLGFIVVVGALLMRMFV